MVLYLRNKAGDNFLDLDIYVKTEEGQKYIDMTCVVPILTYSQLLLSNMNKKDFIIDKFSQLDEIRGWYWEMWKEKNPNHNVNDIVKVIEKEFLEPICKELNLFIVTD